MKLIVAERLPATRRRRALQRVTNDFVQLLIAAYTFTVDSSHSGANESFTFLTGPMLVPDEVVRRSEGNQ